MDKKLDRPIRLLRLPPVSAISGVNSPGPEYVEVQWFPAEDPHPEESAQHQLSQVEAFALRLPPQEAWRLLGMLSKIWQHHGQPAIPPPLSPKPQTKH